MTRISRRANFTITWIAALLSTQALAGPVLVGGDNDGEQADERVGDNDDDEDERVRDDKRVRDDADDEPDAPHRARIDKPANNKLLRAGIAAGATALAVPCAFCCASSWLFACMPISLTAGLAAGGAAVAPLVDDGEMDIQTTLAALGVGALGGLITAAAATGIWLMSPVAVVNVQNVSFLTYSSVHGALALSASVVGTLATAAAVGAVVYAMTPTTSDEDSKTNASRTPSRRNTRPAPMTF